MLDRIPTKPNRYAVYDDAHNFVRYEYHERADEPTQTGDALNKANLLPDAVATALGLTGNPQVRDALAKLETIASLAQTTANGRAQIATGSYTGTGTFGSTNPVVIPFLQKPTFVAVIHSSARWVSWMLFSIDALSSAYKRGGATRFAEGQSAVNPDAFYAKVDANALSFYETGSADNQFNDSGEVYKTILII